MCLKPQLLFLWYSRFLACSMNATEVQRVHCVSFNDSGSVSTKIIKFRFRKPQIMLSFPCLVLFLLEGICY